MIKVPHVFIQNVPDYDIGYMESKLKFNELQHQDVIIKGNAIWIKVGSDLGNGSFKSCFQIANVPKLNSRCNTLILISSREKKVIYQKFKDHIMFH